MSEDYTPAERAYYESLLWAGSARSPLFIGRRTYQKLREYAEWRDRRSLLHLMAPKTSNADGSVNC